VKVDLTVAAIPAFFGAMGAEYLWQKRHPVPAGTRAGDYQLHDTLASLSMGVGSLIAPYVAKKVLDPVTPGVGRYAKVLLGVGAATAVATTIGDVVRRRLRDGSLPEPRTVPAHVREVQEELARLRQAPTPSSTGPGSHLDGPELPPRGAGTPTSADTPGHLGAKVHAGLAVSAVFSASLVASTTWAVMTSGKRLFEKSPADLGTGRLAWAVAIVGWDFLYYWNHRLSHESRWLWAVHVTHHSSERYNLSTALRQSVAESLTMNVPYGALALLGVRPPLIEQARGLNLLYQFWVHTEAIRKIGRVEEVLNSPSHHRVHHGSNRQYLDRNHGGILIIWDKLFGTFEPEDEPVVYGLTKNINSFNPAVIATHEWRDIAEDIASATTWRDRWSFLLRRPGWAYARRGELATPASVAA